MRADAVDLVEVRLYLGYNVRIRMISLLETKSTADDYANGKACAMYDAARCNPLPEQILCRLDGLLQRRYGKPMR